MNPFAYFIAVLALVQQFWIVLAPLIVVFAAYSGWKWRRSGRPLPRGLLGFLPFSSVQARAKFAKVAAVVFGLALLPMLILLPVVMAFVLPFIAITERIKGRRKEAQAVLELLLISIFMGLVAVGLLVPLHLMGTAAYFALGQPAGGMLEALVIGEGAVQSDRWVGFIGIGVVAVLLLLDGFWRLHQARQVDNLATSRARSVAHGLVELQGVARRAEGGGARMLRLTTSLFGSKHLDEEIAPFDLEDRSGSVRIDPRGAHIRSGWLTDIGQVLIGFHEIVLNRRVVFDAETGTEVRWLEDGDYVYVVGHARQERDEGTGALRTVVGPAVQTAWSLPFARAKGSGGRATHNVFFVTDTRAVLARKHLLRGFRWVWLLSFLWLVASVFLIWSASWPQRQAIDPESWRAGRWRGPEPGDGDGIDYSRDGRRFRFEAWVKDLGADSTEALPALLEALAHDNAHFRGPATRALLAMLPGAAARARDAVPLLVRNLGDRRGQVVQLSIIALGQLGPVAAPAVPELIEQLRRTTGTNTYEVTAAILRFQAAKALGRIGPAAIEAVPALTTAQQDPVPYVAEEARQSLLRIRGER